MKDLLIPIAIVGMLCGWFLGGAILERQQERTELILYCKMVYTHKMTNGEHGWPDYEHKYDAQCPRQGLTKL